MEDFPIVLLDTDGPLLVIGLAWLAILGMLALGGVIGLWRRARGWFGSKAPACPNAASFARVRGSSL